MIAAGQHAQASTTSGNTTVTTPGRDTQASGSTFLVFALWYSGTVGATPITDNKGNSYSVLDNALEGGFGGWYICQNGTGGAGHTVTLTTSTGGALTLLFLEITGGLTSGIVDKQARQSDASSPFTSGLTAATAQADELVVSVMGDGNGAYGTSGATPSSGWTIHEEQTDGVTKNSCAIASVVVSATGQYEGGWTNGGVSSGRVYVATFKAAGGGGERPLNPTYLHGVGSGNRFLGNRVQ